MSEDDLEFTLLNKRDVLVYQIPPASSSAGHKADDWKKCIWRGRCRIAGKGPDLMIKMIDANNGQLFAQCSIPNGEYGNYVERVIDSSRYFVLKITNGQRHAFIGLGFDDRNDAFDFNCTLSDFKSTWVDRDKQVEELPTEQAASRDLSLKEGQKITINLKGMEGRPRRQQATEPVGSGFAGLLAPPPPSSGHSRRQQPGVQAKTVQPTDGPQPPPVTQPPRESRTQTLGAAPSPPPRSGSSQQPVLGPSSSQQDDLFGDFVNFQSAADAGPVATQPAAPSAAPPTAGVAHTSAMAAGLAAQLEHLTSSDGLMRSPPAQPPAPGPQQPTSHQAQPTRPQVTPAVPNDPFSDIAVLGEASGVASPPLQSTMQGVPFGKAPPMQNARGGGDPFDEFDIFK